MCVIAGYLGKENAAPILIEMLRREEGLAGGFYTGIVTLHEGVLYHEKVVGDLDTLLRETPALQLPGSVGLIHSRTPGGGGRAWAHPFIDCTGKLAYIANGAMGQYAERVDFTEEVRRLQRRGRSFSSAQQGKVGNYPLLPDGRGVHFSDILCQAIADQYEEEIPGPERLLQAMSETYQRLPGSLVGLCLHADHPDEIVGARHNKPMDIGRLKDGSMVIASCSIAFPEGVVWEMRLPALTGVRFERNGRITLAPFTWPDLIPLGEKPSALEVERVLIAKLRQAGCMNARDFIDSAVPLWPATGVLNEKEVLAFGVIRALLAEGKIELRSDRVPGVLEGQTAPRTLIYWKD